MRPPHPGFLSVGGAAVQYGSFESEFYSTSNDFNYFFEASVPRN